MGPLAIECKRTDENYKIMTDSFEKKTEWTAQNDEIKDHHDNLDKKLTKVITMVQRNFENIERMNNDIINLKKNVAEGQKK